MEVLRRALSKVVTRFCNDLLAANPTTSVRPAASRPRPLSIPGRREADVLLVGSTDEGVIISGSGPYPSRAESR
jgi:hypothetical protein